MQRRFDNSESYLSGTMLEGHKNGVREWGLDSYREGLGIVGAIMGV